jgi:hypothetical protein
MRGLLVHVVAGEAGVEVTRHSPTRPVMRQQLERKG